MNLDPDLPAVRAVRDVLASGLPPSDLAARVLDAIGDRLGWLVGTVWLVDDGAKLLRPAANWRARVHKRDNFIRTTEHVTFPQAVGLPGRAWERGEPVWIDDVTRDGNFSRIEAARAEGLHSAFAFPLRDAGGAVIGVMDYFTDQLRTPMAALETIFNPLGEEIGKALAPLRTELGWATDGEAGPR